MEIYASRKRNVNKGYWMSFENHPRLMETKRSIYVRCVPCLEKLLNQLEGAPSNLILEEPLNCWKVVVTLDNEEEALSLLEAYQEKKNAQEKSAQEIGKTPGTIQSLRGRMGTNDKKSPGLALIFHLHDEDQRDELLADLEKLARRINPQSRIFIERGCGDLYGKLCGKWEKWQPETPIENPTILPVIREKVAKLLRGEFN